jgi:hypothetical protein
MKKIKETSAKFEQLENVVVSNRPEAAAGPGKLLAFPNDRDQETIALPKNLAALARRGMVDLVTLSGKSLEGIGIYDGDQVLCKTAFSRKEITAKAICIVYLPETNETLAKKVIYRKDAVILKSFHPEVEDMIFRPEQVEVQGIVLRLLRKPDDDGRFDRPAADVEPKVTMSERRAKLTQLVERFQKKPRKENLPF